MKLTVKKLKSLIKETIRETRMNLVEAKKMNFNQIMDVLFKLSVKLHDDKFPK